MSSRHPDDFHLQHLCAELPPGHGVELQRLMRVIRHGAPFQFCLLDCRDELYRERLIGCIDDLLQKEHIASTRLSLDAQIHPDFLTVAAALHELSENHRAIHITGGPLWFDDRRLSSANISREDIAREVRCALLLWANPELIARLATVAPDLWSWRAGVFDFSTQVKTPVPTEIPQWRPLIDPRPLPERTRRIAELRGWLNDPQGMDDKVRVVLLDELAELLKDLGDYDEALRLWREESLPIFERHGGVRGMASIQGKIADILFSRGELGAALRIREQEELPIYEQFGDIRAIAITLGQIAVIYMELGKLNTALRILCDQVLPAFESLGDLRDKTVTLSKIAEVHMKLGDLDAALRILREEVLPAFGRLGDLHQKAVAQGKIAAILSARGELDAALRICEQEELPVYERLGNVSDVLACRSNIAQMLLLQARPQDRPRAEALLRQARAAALSMQIPEAEKIAAIMRTHGFDPDASL